VRTEIKPMAAPPPPPPKLSKYSTTSEPWFTGFSPIFENTGWALALGTAAVAVWIIGGRYFAGRKQMSSQIKDHAISV
jgi:hypothetical protein